METEKIKELKRDVNVSMAEFFDKFISKELGLGEDYHLIVEYENDSGELSGEKYEALLIKRYMARTRTRKPQHRKHTP